MMIEKQALTQKTNILYVFWGWKPERGGGNVIDQPVLACMEQSGRILIDYQHKVTQKGWVMWLQHMTLVYNHAEDGTD